MGTARLDLTAKECVVIEVSAGHDAYRLGREDDVSLKFGPHGRATPVLSVRATLNKNGTTLSLIARKGALTLLHDRRARLSCAIVHILNFPDFICVGGAADFNHQGRRLGRVILHSDDWEIEIQALFSTHELVKQLKARGGNAITHVGRITRSDGKTFTRAKLDALVFDLQRFLSFARGAWTSVFGTVGYSRSGQEVYEDWSMRIAAPWQLCQSWFDIHHGESLADAFPGFVRLLHDPQLGSAAYAGLYWYLRSNRAGEGAGVDGGLIIAQAALEGLSLSVLDSVGIALPTTAADKIRAACTHLRLPVAIPVASKALRRAQRNGDFADAPEAITRVRNELVHPKQRLKSRLPPLIPDAWRLAQWYIEVMLLTLAGYKGVYSHRLSSRWIGQVQTFP